MFHFQKWPHKYADEAICAIFPTQKSYHEINGMSKGFCVSPTKKVRHDAGGVMPDEGIAGPPGEAARRHFTAWKAASSAAMRSSAFSMPMERRMVLGLMP